MMYLWVSYKKKICKKNYFFTSFKSSKKGVGDPLAIGTEPGIRIRTKMSRIPNTGVHKFSKAAPYVLFDCSHIYHYDHHSSIHKH
jgi:hypothetical protein